MKKFFITEQTRAIFLMAILLIAISTVLSAQNSLELVGTNEVTADSSQAITISRTVGNDKAIVTVKFDSKTDEIISFEKNGVLLKPEEYYKDYLDVIIQMKKDIQLNKKEEKARNAEYNTLELFFQKANEYLVSKGYKTENASFIMKFKNNWYFNFSNKAYLNNKKLPSKISKEIFKLYYEITGNKGTMIISMPDGLVKKNTDNYRIDMMIKG